MLIRFYASAWVFGILAALLFYGTGNLTPVVSVVFGVLTVGTVFMGMIAVLPSSFAQTNEREIAERRARIHDADPLPSAVSSNIASSIEKVLENGRVSDSRPQPVHAANGKYANMSA